MLRETGFEGDGLAELWATYWIAKGGAPEDVSEPCRTLAERLAAERWPVSTTAQVYGRMAEIEAALVPSRSFDVAGLVLLLATHEGIAVCEPVAADAPLDARGMEALVAATDALAKVLGHMTERAAPIPGSKRPTRIRAA
ncbi:MAG TPA: hypothetical protein VIL65_03235 [Beijerinckiaceae bacterium]